MQDEYFIIENNVNYTVLLEQRSEGRELSRSHTLYLFGIISQGFDAVLRHARCLFDSL
jgi:hypothetical protein